MVDDNSLNEVDILKKEIEGLRHEFSRIIEVNEQYRNEMLSRLSERLESHSTQLEEEIKGRFYGRLKLIMWGATTILILGTAFGLWNVKTAIPRLVSERVDNVTKERIEKCLQPLKEKLNELTEIANIIEPLLSPKWLWDASISGDADHVNRLLKENPEDLIETKNFEGRTALILATMEGHSGVVKNLISKGASVNVKDNHGQTPLIYASKNGYVDVVKNLLAAMVDLELTNKSGATPLIEAINENHRIVVYTLLNHGANVNAKFRDGTTPLMLATSNGENEIVKLLLEFDADVYMSNEMGETALDIAKGLDREEILELLKAQPQK